MVEPEESPLLLLIILASMAGTAAILQKTPLGQSVVSVEPHLQFGSIAGLRGLLAAGVFVHHTYVARGLFMTGNWLTPTNPLYFFAGTGCVAVFFMISGFLFWGKALSGGIRPMPLILSRVRRIMPLYLLSAVLIFLICAFETHFTRVVGWADLISSTARWLAGGLLGAPDINGVATPPVNCGVTWTLQYEWIFYLALPFIAVFCSFRRFALLVAAFLLIVYALKRTGHAAESSAAIVAAPFIGGMLAAYLVRILPGSERPSSRLVSVFVAASFVAGAMAYRQGSATIVAIGLFPAFAAIARGNDIFGLLSLRCIKFLGEISFSVYLLHGIMLLTSLRILHSLVPTGAISYPWYLSFAAALSVVVVTVSSVTFFCVERPFMRKPESRSRDRVPPTDPSLSTT